MHSTNSETGTAHDTKVHGIVHGVFVFQTKFSLYFFVHILKIDCDLTMYFARKWLNLKCPARSSIQTRTTTNHIIYELFSFMATHVSAFLDRPFNIWKSMAANGNVVDWLTKKGERKEKKLIEKAIHRQRHTTILPNWLKYGRVHMKVVSNVSPRWFKLNVFEASHDLSN